MCTQLLECLFVLGFLHSLWFVSWLESKSLSGYFFLSAREQISFGETVCFFTVWDHSVDKMKSSWFPWTFLRNLCIFRRCMLNIIPSQSYQKIKQENPQTTKYSVAYIVRKYLLWKEIILNKIKRRIRSFSFSFIPLILQCMWDPFPIKVLNPVNSLVPTPFWKVVCCEFPIERGNSNKISGTELPVKANAPGFGAQQPCGYVPELLCPG